MGNMIGSGVFLLPASLAPLGWNAIFGWMITIGGSVALALSIAHLAKKFSGMGGLIGILQNAFGRAPAAVLGWSAWVGFWTANATLAVAAVSYLGDWIPVLHAFPAISAIALVWLITGLSLFGLRPASLFQNVTMILKLVPLIAVFIVALVVLGTPGNASPAPFDATEISVPSMGLAVTLTLWAMIGFEAAAFAEDAFERPAFTIPAATIIGTVATGVIYLCVCSAIQLLSDPAELAGSAAPFSYFIDRFWPSGPGHVVGLFAAIAAIGALNGWTIVTGELPRSMARGGMLPRWFAGSLSNGAPRNALVLGAVCASVVLIFNASKSTAGLFTFMALLSTCAALWVYLACAVAAIRQRLGMVSGLVGTAFGAWAMWSAGYEASLLSFVLMASGVPLYWLARRKTQSAEQGV